MGTCVVVITLWNVSTESVLRQANVTGARIVIVTISVLATFWNRNTTVSSSCARFAVVPNARTGVRSQTICIELTFVRNTGA